MNGTVKSGLGFWTALGALMVLGATAQAGLPYLPVVGPPPLRLEVMVHHAAAAKLATAPVPAGAHSPLALGQTNLPPPATPRIAATTPDAGPGPDADRPVGAPLSPTIFVLPTPDLLGITPQMLATYFTPFETSTNVTIGAAIPISFTPPMPPPDKSSHAEYIVK
jgi:hypothetical protein